MLGKNRKIMLRLIGLVKPLTGYMLLAIFMGTLGHLCATFLTIFGGYGVLKLIGYPVSVSLGVLFACMGVAAVLRGVLRYAEQACNHFIAFKLLALLRDKVFGALRRLCPAKLEGRDKGDLIALITSDIELLEVFYAHTISPVAIALIFTVILCIYIGSFYWLLGIIALAAYALVGLVIPFLISKVNGNLGSDYRKGSGELSSFVLDSLRGLPEILQYEAGEKRLQEMKEKTDSLAKTEEKMKRITAWNTSITNLSILLSGFLMFGISTWLCQMGKVEFPAVLLTTLAMLSSFGPVVALANLGSTLQNTFAAGERVLGILEEEPVVKEVTGQKEVTFTGAKVEHVTFSYEGESVLQDISAVLPGGKIIGVTGKSGSGKSTLLRLLMRFWDTKEGKICLSDVPIGQINTENLRNMESFVPQDTHLFHGTIYQNLIFARPDATREDVERACKKASIHEFITSLPNGYDTQVGELGDTLSGGEKQRIGLARAFLHDAPFFLLDEPTSNLDSLNEGVILHSIATESKGKTVLLVSHRPSTMRIADTILSVEHGRMS